MKTPYSQKQALFARLIGTHLVWLFDNGFEVTVGDFYAQSGHMENSVHSDRMAADINIYLAGRWMDGKDLDGAGSWQKAPWEKIGQHWESLDKLAKWGGRFRSVDLNHFSITPDGKRA